MKILFVVWVLCISIFSLREVSQDLWLSLLDQLLLLVIDSSLVTIPTAFIYGGSTSTRNKAFAVRTITLITGNVIILILYYIKNGYVFNVFISSFFTMIALWVITKEIVDYLNNR